MRQDFAPLSRSSIGFDWLFDMLANVPSSEQVDNYPPYNIEKTNEDAYRITFAVAGFAPHELSVTTQPNMLMVAGKKVRNGDGQYLYQGIPARAFQREFALADYVKVSGATLNNGLLSIDLVREVPEALRPKRIPIAGSTQPQQIEGKLAA
jgi:molecular chaperone IbpA